MKLNAEEQAMLDGELGEPRRWAIEHMLSVGHFFDAPDFVEVTQAHIMADTESLGEAGVAFLENLMTYPVSERQVCIPMITDPRGIDFCHYQRLRQTDEMAVLEQRAIEAFESLGILMTNTCINYQTIMPPVRGEHLAFGDTGVVIYCNSVLGAYSNFEGGPSSLAAGLTGRTPRYGLHLDQNRRATRRFRVEYQPQYLSDWGALGGIVGARTGSYWDVPVIEGIESNPDSDEMKHLGAAMASFGSVPLFHLVGITPEAPTLQAVCDPGTPAEAIGEADFKSFFARYGGKGEKVDVVVFSAPQLSLLEMQSLAELLDDKTLHKDTDLLAVTSPVVAADARRLGLVERIESSGALVLEGMCFYQSYAREMGEANGWKRLMTNSVKLTNIIGGYGYEPTLSNMENCVASAIAGEIV
ncbi:MAG: aconitase X catalytic domain-containing protein [Gammaproteobacteria bacterium]|nr:aconitase X catalytic domain-containing protein [Gammaproteobacteria bacterium]MDH3859300.1 aconitase X catalytic domain-containing protein [Gammaproteobacteria bacterium]